MTKLNSKTLDEYTQLLLPAIEQEMQICVADTQEAGLEDLHFMMAYHLGWQGDKSGPQAHGKRIRPLLVLLTAEAAGGDWKKALPASAAVELVHNFSLIHDDIEDNSPLRRGRETVWKKWNIPQAINTGDSMFALAHLALQRLNDLVSPEIVLKAQQILPRACLTLTQGQYLDLSYETRQDLTVKDYWPMIHGKTASLIATCTELGSLISGNNSDTQANYRNFGENIGLAFQVYDDILGIWGNTDVTGKSTSSDLVAGKKSLPVLFGLQQNREFARRWREGPISLEDVPEITMLLENEGAYDYAKNVAEEFTDSALKALDSANPQGPARQALIELSNELLNRNT